MGPEYVVVVCGERIVGAELPGPADRGLLRPGVRHLGVVDATKGTESDCRSTPCESRERISPEPERTKRLPRARPGPTGIRQVDDRLIQSRIRLLQREQCQVLEDLITGNAVAPADDHLAVPSRVP